MTETDRLTELLAEACALQARSSAALDAESLIAEATIVRAQLCATAHEVGDGVLAADAEGAISELTELLVTLEARSARLLRASA